MISGLLRVFAVAAIVLVTGARLAPERAMAAKFAFHDVVVVDTDLLNVRSNPGTDGSIRLTIRQGIRLMIVDGPKDDDGYTWYKVNILGDSDEAPLTGWVAQDFITLEEQGLNINNANWVEVNDGPVNMRSGAGTDKSIVDVLDTGETADVVADSSLVVASNYTWINLSQDGGETGWVAVDFLTPLANDPGTTDPGNGDNGGFAGAEGVEVVDGPVNVRDEPSLSGAVTRVAATGDKFNRFADTDLVEANGFTWIKVFSFSSGPGWIATEFLSPIADMPCGDGACYPEELNNFFGHSAAIVTDGPVNLRAEAGTSADVLMLLENGDYLWFTDAVVNMATEADGYTWLEVSVAGETGWVAIDFISPVD